MHGEDQYQGILGVTVTNTHCTGTVEQAVSMFRSQWRDAAHGMVVPPIVLLTSSSDRLPGLSLRIDHIQAKELLDLLASALCLEYRISTNAIVFRERPITGGEIIKEILPLTEDGALRLGLSKDDITHPEAVKALMMEYGISFLNGTGAAYEPSRGGLVAWNLFGEREKMRQLVWLANQGHINRNRNGQRTGSRDGVPAAHDQ